MKFEEILGEARKGRKVRLKGTDHEFVSLKSITMWSLDRFLEAEFELEPQPREFWIVNSNAYPTKEIALKWCPEEYIIHVREVL